MSEDFKQDAPEAEEEKPAVPKLMMEALDGEIGERPAFWYMRQAGRYLPEYRQIRQKAKSFLDMALTPEIAAEITLQPIRRFHPDAAIIFSDILMVPYALEQKVDFKEGEGPVLDPIREVNDLGKLRGQKELIVKKFQPVADAIKIAKEGLPPDVAMLGFAGAPWTVATYMIEGGGSKDFAMAKKWAYRDPKGFSYLQTIIIETTVEYLSMQVEAGADAVMIFDSHAGVLPPVLFDPLVIRPTQRLVKLFKTRHPKVPVIGFPRFIGDKYQLYIRTTGVNAVQIDEKVTIKEAHEVLSMLMPVQGNLDPAVVLAGGEAMKKAAENVMSKMADRPFILNLGHGMHKATPVKHVEYLSELVRRFSNLAAAAEMLSA